MGSIRFGAVLCLTCCIAACSIARPSGTAADAPVAVPLAPTVDGRTPPSGRDPATIPPPITLVVGGPAVAGTATASIFDSRDVAEQLDRRTIPGDARSPGSLLPAHKRPGLPAGLPNTLTFGHQGSRPRSQAGAAFPAISSTQWAPPDPCLAVGPSHIVATVNMKVAWYLKDGTPQFENFLDSTGNPGFFEELGAGNYTFDPKCFYDPFAQRFVVLALEYYTSTQESWITFAVSDDADPNGIWFKYRTPAIIGIGDSCRYWVDYPGLGYDGQAWYVTANLFRLSSSPQTCGGFGGTLVRVIEKQGAMAGATAVWRDVADPSASMQVATARQAGDEARLVYVASSTSLGIVRVIDPISSPVLMKTTCPVPALVSDSSAPTPSGTLAIVDLRVFNAFVQDDRVFVGHHTGGTPNANATAAWYEIDAAAERPSLIQTGRVAIAGDEHTFFPAIAVNDAGSIGIIYGRSSPTLHARIEVAGRVPCDPPGALGAPLAVVSGSHSPSGTNARWGDYFALVIDPEDGETFWGIGEIQSSTGWRTEVVSFRVARTADINQDGTVDANDLTSLLAAWQLGGSADLDRNGVVDGFDLSLLLADWGPCAP